MKCIIETPHIKALKGLVLITLKTDGRLSGSIWGDAVERTPTGLIVSRLDEKMAQLECAVIDTRTSHKLPHCMLEALQGYLYHGKPLNVFLRAVVANDLAKAIDEGGAGELLSALIKYLREKFLPGSWGSYREYDRWVAHHGADFCQQFNTGGYDADCG